MKKLMDLELDQKKVLIRVDFNVPLDNERKITDDGRILGALPTIEYALSKNVRLIIASHLGRPKGKPVPEFSMAPVAERLGELLGRDVKLAPDCVGPDVRKMAEDLKPGEVMLLENLRYHAEEQADDADFAAELAALCDVYINDAFAVCHRVNASVASVTRFAPACGAGLLLDKELSWFHKAMSDPRRPVAAVVGGAKISSKLRALENMIANVDKILIGGAMANTFLKQEGLDVGKSLYEPEQLSSCEAVREKAARKGVKLYLPVDVVAAERSAPDAETKNVPVQEIPAEWTALDIGPATVRLYGEALENTRTIIWNGPMGAFETDAFSRGTSAVADILANSHALTVIGGGDTGAAVHQSGLSDRMSYISTGGGAFLTLMEGRPLPAVQALEAAS